MTDRETAITINVRLQDYRDVLVAQIGRHVADLTHALVALQEGTFVQHAKSKGPQSLFHVEYTNLDVQTGAEQRHIQTCFKAVVATFIRFLDQMIAMQRLLKTGVTLDRSVSQSEILSYARQQVERAITTVASDRSLTNPKKIALFPGISDWAKRASDGLFALRRCYEHHGGVATSNFIVCYRAMRLFIGDEEITNLPCTVKANQGISLRMVDKEIAVIPGRRPELDEQQLRDIVDTITMLLATEILEAVSKGIASN